VASPGATPKTILMVLLENMYPRRPMENKRPPASPNDLVISLICMWIHENNKAHIPKLKILNHSGVWDTTACEEHVLNNLSIKFEI
jgi:hypothetical protein